MYAKPVFGEDGEVRILSNHEITLGDGRILVVETWALDGGTYVTYAFSAVGIEEDALELLRQGLEKSEEDELKIVLLNKFSSYLKEQGIDIEEEYYDKSEPYEFSDEQGNDFWAVTVSAGPPIKLNL